MNSGYSPGEVVPLPEDFRTTKIPLILVLFFRRPPPTSEDTWIFERIWFYFI